MDKRIVARNVKKKLLDHKTYEKEISQLQDVEENADYTHIEEEAVNAKADATTTNHAHATAATHEDEALDHSDDSDAEGEDSDDASDEDA